MIFSARFALISLRVGLALGFGMGFALPAASAEATCDRPALAQVVRHKIVAGETLAGIAQRHNLIPATLMGMNPSLRSGKLPIGTEILIPPYNGIRVEASRGQSWRDLAEIYKIRADVLFEVNGCQATPKVVFVPGVNWSPNTASRRDSPQSGTLTQILKGYPLPAPATMLLGYGWQLRSNTEKVAFHSGIDLFAQPGTPVLAAGDGTVAFAGKQGTYGNLVVINHRQGWQTRYAQLALFKVRVGQSVSQGTTIALTGTSGTPSSSRPHLHFEIRSNSKLGWVAENPDSYLQRVKQSKREGEQ
jgi:lysostaphin